MGQREYRKPAAQAVQRTGLTGSAFVRLLAGLVGPQAPLRETREAFAQGLGQWTAWTDAIALSAALDGPLNDANVGGDAASIDDAPPLPGSALSSASTVIAATSAFVSGVADDARRGDRDDCRTVREQLAQAIRRSVGAAGYSPLGVDLGYGPFRQCHLINQQAMGTGIAALRARVRNRIPAVAPTLARLATVDATLEQVVGVQEKRLLGTVPTLLERHHHRLHAQPHANALEQFRHDLLAVLLAELSLRLEPVIGLLDAIDEATEQSADLGSDVDHSQSAHSR